MSKMSPKNGSYLPPPYLSRVKGPPWAPNRLGVLAFGLTYAAKHRYSERGVRGYKFAAVANLAMCAFPRGTDKPSNDALRKNITSALYGDIHTRWTELVADATTTAVPPPRTTEAADTDMSTVMPELEPLDPDSYETKRLTGKLLFAICGNVKRMASFRFSLWESVVVH